MERGSETPSRSAPRVSEAVLSSWAAWVGVSSPLQRHSSKDHSWSGSQDWQLSRDSRAAGRQQQLTKHEALASSRGSWLPGVGEEAGPPQECACLCRLACRSHSSSLRAPWPLGTLSQLYLLAFLPADQSCFALAVQERQMPRPSLASSVGTRAGNDLAAAGPWKGGLVLLAGRRDSWQPPLRSGCSLLQDALHPSFLNNFSVFRAQMKHLPFVRLSCAHRPNGVFLLMGFSGALCSLYYHFIHPAHSSSTRVSLPSET